MTIVRFWLSLTLFISVFAATVLGLSSLAVAQGGGLGGNNFIPDSATLGGSEITLRTTELTAGSPELPFRDRTVTAAEPPCAEYGAGSPSFAAGADGGASEEAVDREQEVLDASTFERPADADPVSHERGAAKSLESPQPNQTGKPAKSPVFQVAASTFLQTDTSEVDAVFDLWATIRAVEEDLADILTSAGEPECLVYYWCGGERVDDVLFGGISNGPEGAYYDYVDGIASMLATTAHTAVPLADVILHRDGLASDIADINFGDQPRADLMPVFYFCRIGEAGPLELTDPIYSPSFAWATTIADQHDVDGARFDALETLRTLLEGNKPQMQTIPPVEKGYTYVRLPMWLWLENIDDMGQYRIEAISEEGTARLTTRATLIGVTWQLGDATITCEIDDMQPFIHGTNSITDPTPQCSHMFSQVGEYTMTATAQYYIEEQVSFRGSDQFDWPDAPWTEHPTDPVATVSNQTDTMSIGEIVAVNVPIDD